MNLQPNSSIPLYQQVKEELKILIKRGLLKSGQKIPTETELSKRYNVSRITIRRAIEELCKDGYLLKKQGKGTFVLEHKIQRKIEHLLSFSQACKTNDMSPSSKVNKKQILYLSSDEESEIIKKTGKKVVFTQRIRLADNSPIMCENNYFPYSDFSFLLNESLDNSLYLLLKEKYNINVSMSKNSFIDVIRANGDIAKQLQVANGEPLFYLYTEIFDDKENLVHIGKQYIIGTRYRFYLDDSYN